MAIVSSLGPIYCFEGCRIEDAADIVKLFGARGTFSGLFEGGDNMAEKPPIGFVARIRDCGAEEGKEGHEGGDQEAPVVRR